MAKNSFQPAAALAAVNRGFGRRISTAIDTDCAGYVSFVLAILTGILLVWKRWMTLELILFSLLPFVYLFIFDEISTTYKTPFIVLCSLLLSAGAIGYQRSRPNWPGWLILLSVAAVTLLMASHAANNFWVMSADLGYQECFPDANGCAPLAGRGTPWWILFFS